jgi:hypothetical protein
MTASRRCGLGHARRHTSPGSARRESTRSRPRVATRKRCSFVSDGFGTTATWEPPGARAHSTPKAQPGRRRTPPTDRSVRGSSATSVLLAPSPPPVNASTGVVAESAVAARAAATAMSTSASITPDRISAVRRTAAGGSRRSASQARDARACASAWALCHRRPQRHRRTTKRRHARSASAATVAMAMPDTSIIPRLRIARRRSGGRSSKR